MKSVKSKVWWCPLERIELEIEWGAGMHGVGHYLWLEVKRTVDRAVEREVRRAIWREIRQSVYDAQSVLG